MDGFTINYIKKKCIYWFDHNYILVITLVMGISFFLDGQAYDHWFQTLLPITLFVAISQLDMSMKNFIYLFFRDEVICL